MIVIGAAGFLWLGLVGCWLALTYVLVLVRLLTRDVAARCILAGFGGACLAVVVFPAILFWAASWLPRPVDSTIAKACLILLSCVVTFGMSMAYFALCVLPGSSLENRRRFRREAPPLLRWPSEAS